MPWIIKRELSLLIDGIINGQLASVLARFRHVNTLAIVDGPFPSYPDVELVDLAVIRGFPTIPNILDAILPKLELTGLILANEFSQKVDRKIHDEYVSHHRNLPTTLISHEEFKIKVGKALCHNSYWRSSSL
jgi:D-ribose pyranase